MQKRRIRSLVTLVLALAATGLLSAQSHARELRSHDGAPAIGAAAGAKLQPVRQSGEPDQPLVNPPPPVRVTGGSPAPNVPDVNTGGGFSGVIRWISLLWESWFEGPTL
jgi:hypothetical protein